MAGFVVEFLCFLLFLFVFVRLRYHWWCGRCQFPATLRGRTYLITGSTSGIGLETARQLYVHGATVVMLVRDVKKAEKCRQEMLQYGEGGEVEIIHCDLTNVDSVRRCSRTIIERFPSVSALVNNAGQGGEPGHERRVTDDGLEQTMMANYFGHFLLTFLLLPLLSKQKGEARVINVSSVIHTMCKRLPVDDSLNFELEQYSPLEAYCRTKTALILHARHLATLTRDRGISAFSLHPGVLATPISRYFLKNMFGEFVARHIESFAMFITSIFAKGAQTSLMLAVNEGMQAYSGDYFVDCSPSRSSPLSSDPVVAERLWRATTKLLHLPGDPFAVRSDDSRK